MRSTLATLSLPFLLLLAPSAVAQDPAQSETQEETGEALFYSAFYQETALRDFAAAAATYRQFLAGDPGDLAARAHAGLARVMEARGEHVAAREEWARVLALEPEDEEALAALARDEGPSTDERIDEELRRLVRGLESDKPKDELALYGARAIPALAEGLTLSHPRVRRSCAWRLFGMRTNQAAADALEAGLPVLPIDLVDELLAGFQHASPHYEQSGLFAALFQRARAVHRAEAVTRVHTTFLSWWRNASPREGPMADLVGLIERVFADPAYIVRKEALQRFSHFPDAEGWDERVQFAIDRAIDVAVASGNEEERQVGLRAALYSPSRASFYFAELRPYFLGETKLNVRDAVESWSQVAIPRGVLAPEQAYELLGSTDAAARAHAWTWLALGDDGPRIAVEDLQPHALQATRDFVRLHGDLNDRQSREFGHSIERFRYADEELAEIWVLLSNGGVGSIGRYTRRRASQLMLTEILQRNSNPEQQERFGRTAATVWTNPKELSWICGEMSRFGLLVRSETLFAACLASESSPRWAAYKLLAWSEGAKGLREAVPAPHLLNDLATGSQEPREFLLALGKEARFDDVLGSLADLDVERAARGLGYVASTRGVDTLFEYLEDLRQRDDFGEGAANALFWSFLKAAEESTETIAALLRQAETDSSVRASLLWSHENLHAWPYDEVARLVRLELSQPSEHPYTANALNLVVNRDLGIGMEEVAPFLRSRNPNTRLAADQAIDRIRKSLEVQRLIAGFGADARAESIAVVRKNATHEDPVRRRAAALGIAALGDPSGVALLFELLDDDDAGVRKAALDALERLGTGGETQDD